MSLKVNIHPNHSYNIFGSRNPQNFFLHINMFVVAIILLAASAPAAPPDWIRTGEHNRFPNDRYITSVGISGLSGSPAEDRANAEADAYRSMATRLQSVVQTKTRISMSEHQHGLHDDALFESEYFVYVDIQTNLELRDVRITDRFVDDEAGMLYVLAVLDREATGQRIAREIKNLENEISRSIKHAKGAFDNRHQTPLKHGDVRSALDLLINSYEQSIRFNELLTLIEVIQPGHNVDMLEENPIQSNLYALESLMQSVRVSVAGGESQDLIPGQALADPLQLLIQTGSGDMYSGSPGIPVVYRVIEGFLVIDRSTPTDMNGISSVYISEVGRSSSDRYLIMGWPDWSAWQRDEPRFHLWNQVFERHQHEVSFELHWVPVKHNLSVAIIMPDDGDHSMRQIGIILEEKMRELGFDVRILTPKQYHQNDEVSSVIADLLASPDEAAGMDRLKSGWPKTPHAEQTDLKLFSAISARDSGKTRIGYSATANAHFRVYKSDLVTPIMIHNASASAVASDFNSAKERAYRSLARNELEALLDKLITNEHIRRE